MDRLLEDKVAVVTGATAGIGKAIALRFAQHGAMVYVVGTNAERGQKVVEEIASLGGEGSFFALDVSDYQTVAVSFKEMLSARGRIDVLVNNAGITRDGLLLRMKEDDWDRVLAVNLKSCFNTCQAVLRPMMKQRSGSVVNVSSVSGLTGNPGQVNYAASKSGMLGFTKALAKEIASRGVRANVIAPGYIQTQMTDALNEQQKEAILQHIPLDRMGQPMDIANAALFLASDMGSYVTGQVLTVDGGMTM